MPDTNQSTPADLEAFDLDGFIAGVVQPSKTVPIVQDRTLGQQLQDAMQAVADLEGEQQTAKAEGRPSKRRAATVDSPELEEAREHLANLQTKAADGFVFVHVEGVTKNVRKEAVQDAQKAPGGQIEAYNLHALARSARIYKRDPRTHEDERGKVMTAEQWDRFAEAIGVLQWDHIIGALDDMSSVGVLPDFSQPASHSPDGDTSSKS